MTKSSGFPYQTIFDYLADVGNERDLPGFYQKTIQGIACLVPYDSVFVLFRKSNFDLLPESYGVEVPTKAQIEYKEYYDQINCCRLSAPFGTPLTYADWRWDVFRYNEFYQDFIRPLHYTSSMGVKLWTDNNCLDVTLGFNRTGYRGMSEQELTIFATIQPHLKNLYNLQKKNSELRTNKIHSIEIKEKYRLLSKREAEVAALICQRLTMNEIATKLLLSPRTVETYVENIKEKLGVKTKRELIIKLTRDEESKDIS